MKPQTAYWQREADGSFYLCIAGEPYPVSSHWELEQLAREMFGDDCLMVEVTPDNERFLRASGAFDTPDAWDTSDDY
ncbi:MULTISPECIES: hypothetical protein [Gammaproteobacteria]|uniref:hypothetical protein n=1 Tax=Gammaproteobacteria TaxID=1236 RepID=UPI003A909B8C